MRYKKPFHNDQQDQSLIYGMHAVTEAIRAGKEIDRMFIQEGLKSDLFAKLRRLTKEHNIHFQIVPQAKLQRLALGKNHQGVAAFLSPVTFHKIEDILPGIFERGKTPLLIILDRITDVRNFGAIARTAECAGADAIIIPSRGAAQINADAVKTSAGALHTLPVCREDNLKNTIEYLKESGIKIVACTEKASETYDTQNLTGPIAIIMGSEEDGISGEYLKRSDIRVQIPMLGSISSLNVSVAAGILIFDVLRQRRNTAT